MKNFKSYIKALFLLLPVFGVIVSCEEVIEIDLNEADSKMVIEGTITDQAGPYTVRISRTTDYYYPGVNPAVPGADVIISDNAGNVESLLETGPGIYQTVSLQGIPGVTYNLSVGINGENYEASSKMPLAKKIDSLYNIHEKRGPHGYIYSIGCIFTDNPGVEDFCRLKIYQNGEAEPSYFLYNGRLSDGNVVEYERFRQLDLELNDIVKVELLSIDQDVYEYYSTLSDVVAADPRGFASTKIPANPNSNLSGDALGYFGAYTVSSDSIVIK